MLIKLQACRQGECQAYLQAALVVVRRFRLAHSCSCSGDGRDRLPHASPSSLTLPFNITHNLHGPSRRRTSPKVSLNSSVTPGFMMCWCCLLLSNSHEEVAAPLPPAHPEGRHQSLHGRKVFTGLAAERAPVRVPAAWRAWPQPKVWRSGTQPPWVARRFPRGRCELRCVFERLGGSRGVTELGGLLSPDSQVLLASTTRTRPSSPTKAKRSPLGE